MTSFVIDTSSQREFFMLLPNYTVPMPVGGLLRIANEQGRQHEPTLSQQNYEMYVQHVLENLKKFEEEKNCGK